MGINHFQYGSRWLRADFHLHTKADKAFVYDGDDNYYIKQYIDALFDQDIEIGVITNHNRFDLDEFKSLHKTATGRGIMLIAGVELYIKEGAGGVHLLIAFSDDWWKNKENTDYINQFITSAFKGRASNAILSEKSDSDFIGTLRELEAFKKDYFVVCAHVEDDRGFWKELKQNDLIKICRDKLFKNWVAAFQKVRTHANGAKSRVEIQRLIGANYPAEVEGSDPKKIDEIGKGKSCWLKIGDHNFGAIKYALFDHEHRVSLSEKKPSHNHSFIRSVSFEGGILDGETVNFSPELNTLIGIRGSGKSAILETIRYVLDIPFGDKALDKEYKNNLISHTLGSGGKATVLAVDEWGHEYEIRRISKEKPDVYIDGTHHPGISIRETIIRKPIYFGQNDLSSTGEGFEKDLVEKIVGEKLTAVRRAIDNQKFKVVELADSLKRLSDAGERRKEYEANKTDSAFRLEFYKQHHIEEKLQKRVGFDADHTKCSNVVDIAASYLEDLRSFVDQHEDDLRNQLIYTSEQNAEFFRAFLDCFGRLIASFDRVKSEYATGRSVLEDLREKLGEFSALRDGLKEEFAVIERKLADELQESGAKTVDLDKFRSLRRKYDDASRMLEAIEKEEAARAALKNALLSELAKLGDLWHDEFVEVKSGLDKVNSNNTSLSIEVDYKGDKPVFIKFMKSSFQGSKIREATFQSLAETFPDFIGMYKEPDKLKDILGNWDVVFREYFDENLASLLTFQVPSKFTIKYRGKELKDHSLGQRASALILFILSQRENDVFIIDQPEDDLDNQTIYEDVIKLIRQLKPNAQFIFATHNPNFPVLGDAEQIVSCVGLENKILVQTGSIDSPVMQQKIIDIMEGGREAFEMREGRYKIWKPQSFWK